MVVNKFYLLIFLCFTVFGCSGQFKNKQNTDELKILNLIVQAIHSEINVSTCFRKKITPDCQCENAFSFRADSIVLFNEITDNILTQEMKEKNCELLPINNQHFQNISFYKKFHLISKESFDRNNQLPRTAYVYVRSVWQCGEKYLASVGYINQKAFSGHKLTFSKGENGALFLENIELMGYS